MKKQIKQITPKIGDIVRHGGFGYEDNKNYPCDVKITSGSFERNGRISNFWSWKRILPDGTINNVEESGYGEFYESLKGRPNIKVILRAIDFYKQNKVN